MKVPSGMHTEIFTGKMSAYLNFAIKYLRLQKMHGVYKAVAKYW